MKLFPITLSFLLAAPAGLANAVSVDIACMSSRAGESKSLEFRTYYDAALKWSAAAVKYEGSTRAISLILKNEEIEIISPDRPYEVTSVWLEVIDAKSTGEYKMVRQGVSIPHFSYTNFRSKKTFSFGRDPNVEWTESSGCEW